MGHLTLNQVMLMLLFLLYGQLILRFSRLFVSSDYSSGLIAVGGAVSFSRLVSDVTVRSLDRDSHVNSAE